MFVSVGRVEELAVLVQFKYNEIQKVAYFLHIPN